MKSYIHLYKTNQEFTKAYNGPDYVEPWLSLTEENMTIGYSKPKLTAIAFNSITWATDVPATGGTATKENCSFKVYAKYDNGISVNISSDATVTGELTVPSSTATTRHEAGQLTLTASYSGFTATGNVTAYQEAAAPDFSTEPLTFNILSAGTINWVASHSDIAKAIKYKLNDNEWTPITSSTEGVKIEVDADDKIQFIGNNAAYCGGNPELYSTLGSSTAGFEVEGNIMSLINSTDFITTTTLDSELTFVGLFSDCTGLTSAENLILPATTLANGCYDSMFMNCTSLTTAPALPATTLTRECYYGMFNGCTNLTTAPALPATTLTDNCYNSMFQGCTNLTTAPTLPATTLAGNCYRSMFNGCTSLNYIKCLATDISTFNCTRNWVNGVAATGKFVKASSMTSWTTGVKGIPSGWTVQDAS